MSGPNENDLQISCLQHSSLYSGTSENDPSGKSGADAINNVTKLTWRVPYPSGCSFVIEYGTVKPEAEYSYYIYTNTKSKIPFHFIHGSLLKAGRKIQANQRTYWGRAHLMWVTTLCEFLCLEDSQRAYKENMPVLQATHGEGKRRPGATHICIQIHKRKSTLK